MLSCQYSVIPEAKEPILHPLTYQEFLAWKQAMRRDVNIFETKLLFLLDRYARVDVKDEFLKEIQSTVVDEYIYLTK